MITIHEALQISRLDNLNKGSLCIFAGAGISLNSGIPVVAKIKRYIIGKLCDDEKEQEMFLSSKIPFEVFVEILFRTYIPPVNDEYTTATDDKKELIKKILYTAAWELLNVGDNLNKHKVFFDLFGHNSYRPNNNHYFIAEMLKNGMARFAVTTNFDLLIEKAYHEITGRDLPVYFPDSEEQYQYPCLFKLHGGCQSPETIQTTINKIASNDAQERCRKMINHVFNEGAHSTVMILGYSFSDVFDISPSIEGISNSSKRVVNIKHPDKADDYSLIDCCLLKDKQPIFKGIKGYQLHCVTDDLVCSLWERYIDGAEMRYGNPDFSPLNLDDIIGKWAANLSEPYQKYFICGRYMTYLERTKEAINYFEKCLETKKAKTDTNFRIKVLQGLLSEDIADWSDRRKELDMLLEHADAHVKIDSLLGQGQFKLMMNNPTGALIDCEKALELARNTHNKLHEGQCYSSIANILNTLKEYKKAIEAGEKALAIFQDENDFECLKIRCNIYCFLASSYECLDDRSLSSKYFDKAISLAEKLNVESEIARIYFFFANAYDIDKNPKENYRKAINYYRLGYEYCKDREAIKPMLKESGYYLLSSSILNMYAEDKDSVTQEELGLAYDLIKGVAERGVLVEYNKTVEKDVITCYVNACYGQRKVAEALDLILRNMITTDAGDKTKLKQLLALAIYWYEMQEIGSYWRVPCEKEKGPAIMSKGILEESLRCFRDNDHVNGAIALQKAFEYIPVNRSFRNSVPYFVYSNLHSIRRELNNLYDRLD